MSSTSTNTDTDLPAAATASPCCSITTLVGASAASFVCSSILILVFLCLRFLHLNRSDSEIRSARLRQRQQQPKLGLDAAKIALIPSFPYRRECSTSAASAPECAVCLSVFDEGQTVRQLPGCKHVFHQVCVDVWLFSNASCPVCRGNAEPPGRAEERAGASSAFVVPIEMLDDERVASSTPGDLERQ